MFNLHFFSVETGIGMLVETVEGESQGGRIEALVGNFQNGGFSNHGDDETAHMSGGGFNYNGGFGSNSGGFSSGGFGNNSGGFSSGSGRFGSNSGGFGNNSGKYRSDSDGFGNNSGGFSSGSGGFGSHGGGKILRNVLVTFAYNKS